MSCSEKIHLNNISDIVQDDQIVFIVAALSALSVCVRCWRCGCDHSLMSGSHTTTAFQPSLSDMSQQQQLMHRTGCRYWWQHERWGGQYQVWSVKFVTKSELWAEIIKVTLILSSAHCCLWSCPGLRCLHWCLQWGEEWRETILA